MNTYFVDAHRPENEHLVGQILAETQDLGDSVFISPRADEHGLVTVGIMDADEAAAYAANGGHWGYQRLGDWRAEAREIEMAENYEHEMDLAEAELTRLAGNWQADEEARVAAQDALNNTYTDGISPEAWAEAAHRAVWGLIPSESGNDSIIAKQAIAESIARDTTPVLRLAGDELNEARRYLLNECLDWVKADYTGSLDDVASVEEYWGEGGGGDWRVHLLIEGHAS